MTPQIFWKYRTDLITSSRVDLENFIKQILLSSPSCHHPSRTGSSSLESKSFPVPIHKINGHIQLGTIWPFNPHVLPSFLRSIGLEDASTAYIILDFSPPPINSDAGTVEPGATDGGILSPQNILHITTSPKGKAKLDAYFLQHVLPTAIPFIKSHLSSQPPKTIIILEGRGNDPGTRLDISVGLAVTAIQLFFDQNGALLKHGQKMQGGIQSSGMYSHMLIL